MTKTELNLLKGELKRLKPKINQQDFILVLKAVSIAFLGGHPTIYFDLLYYLDIRNSSEQIEQWEHDIQIYIRNKKKIHPRD